MSLIGIVLLVLLILLVVGGVPSGPWWGATGHTYGWGPSGLGLVLLIILVILLASGRL